MQVVIVSLRAGERLGDFKEPMWLGLQDYGIQAIYRDVIGKTVDG